MTQTTQEEEPCDSQEANDPIAPTRVEDEIHAWNFWVFSAYHVLMRVGWVFKTESVVLPAFLDVLGANATIRGLLPVLSRLGNSGPQYLLSQRVGNQSHLAPTLLWSTVAQAIPWLVLAGVLFAFPQAHGPWWIFLFLVAYSVFWVANGVALLSSSALQGKLVSVTKRGKLLTVSNLIGCILAIIALLAWMLPNLHANSGAAGFGTIFSATGLFFVGTALSVACFKESANQSSPKRSRLWEQLRQTRQLVGSDPQFARLLSVVSLFSIILALFPHFASFGMASAGGDLSHIAYWVIAQNAGTAVWSVIAGPLVDRYGNQRVLRLLLFGLAMAPLSAIAVCHLDSISESGYWLVFVMVGLTPVTQRTLVNFVLELAPQHRHTDYLATLNAWQMSPLFMGPPLGILIDLTSYSVGFTASAAVLAFAGFLAGTLKEPRATTV